VVYRNEKQCGATDNPAPMSPRAVQSQPPRFFDEPFARTVVFEVLSSDF
jgi:hypothetical protein